MVHGATDARLFRRHQPFTGRPRSLWPLWIAATRRDLEWLLDWTPAHFPRDSYGLSYLTARTSTNIPTRGRVPIPTGARSLYNYGRNEVQNFLISNALFWLDKFTTLTGCAWMRSPPCCIWTIRARRASGYRTATAGAKNLDAIDFLKRMNEVAYFAIPRVLDHRGGVHGVAERVAPDVSRRAGVQHLKWNMGWMNDTLHYFSKDPVFRRYEHNKLTFSLLYASAKISCCLFLPRLKWSTKEFPACNKMPGDMWQQFANLRLAARLPIRASWEEAAVHGAGVRAAARVERSREPGLASAGNNEFASRACSNWSAT